MGFFRLHIAVCIALGTAWLIAGCGGDDPRPPSPGARATGAAAVQDDPTPAIESATNSLPEIRELSFEPENPVAGELVNVDVDAVDEDGDPFWLSYSWRVAGEDVDHAESDLLLEGASKGDWVEVSVIVTDGKGTSQPVGLAIQIRNSAPVLMGIGISPKGPLHKGGQVVLQPKATDSDGDSVEYQYEWAVNGRPVREDSAAFETDRLRRGDVIGCTVTATDGADQSTPFVIPELTIANSPPQFVSEPGGISQDGVFRYRPVIEDFDGDPVSLAIEGAPEGMNVDSIEGTIAWRPSSEQKGIHRPVVVATDSHGDQARQEIEVDVADWEAESPPAAGAP